MSASASELATLRTVAQKLGPLRDEVAFVGGMIRSLLITDPGASGARPTDDIDVVAGIASQVDYYALATKLRALGFVEDQREQAPLCRWLVDGLTVDIMPDHENVLGFSNRWYVSARTTATWASIGADASDRIRVVDAPHFVATKLEAFRGRGHGDFYHHDMEDLVAVVDGRGELFAELNESPQGVRAFVSAEIDLLVRNEAFMEALPGHLPGDRASQARLPILEQRLRRIADLRKQ